MMDYLMMRDGRNPYGSEGGYVSSRRMRRRRRGDRGMMGEDYADYESDMARGRGRDRAGDYEDMGRGSDYERRDRARGGRDYGDYEGGDMARGGRGRDRGGDYGDYESDMARGGGRGRSDGHYPMMQGYMPIEAMGRFNGYWGMPEEDYGYDMARGGRGGNRGGGRGRDRGYDDYGYDYAGDYGEKLTKEEMEHWRKKLEKEVGDEQSKNFFKKENIEQKARQMGIQMREFDAEELALASYMLYSDYCKSLKPYVGQNMDVFVKMGEEFLNDPDSAVKGGEKLALYFEIVSGEDD